MLKELLVEIGNCDYLSKRILASKLGTPVSLIEGGLRQLVRLGYLAEDEGLQNCDLPCGKCPYTTMCNQNQLQTMTITKKGRQFLAHYN